MQVRHVGQIHQRHVRLFGKAVALAAVAGAAGGDAVHPGVAAAARGRDDVLARQVVDVEEPAAVGADMAVANEELGVRQRGRLPPGAARHAAAHGDDRVNLDARLQAGAPLHAAAQHIERVAERPGDAVAGIDDGRFLGRNPGLRSPRHIELKHFHAQYSLPPSVIHSVPQTQ